MFHSSSYTYFTNEHSLTMGKYVLINKLFVSNGKLCVADMLHGALKG